MYSLARYGTMMADSVRMDAYRDALRRAVQPGSIVVDLGAGPGIMSFLAVQCGAGKVYAIDPSDAIEVGRAMARFNGMDGRIEFFRALSSAVTLPERADVIVSDIRGILPPWNGHFTAIADARERFLKPGGALIPRRDRLLVALADAPGNYADMVGGWSSDGLDLSIGRRMAANTWSRSYLNADQLLTAPVECAEVDYRRVCDSALAGRAHCEAGRAGTGHGLAVWFDAELMDGIGFSNAPGQTKTIYGQGFFPLLEPVRVDRGDRVEVNLRADPSGDDYTWSWHTAVRSAAGALRADYRQSTFLGTPLSTSLLRKQTDVYVPKPTEDADIDRSILEFFGSGRSLREIAPEIASRFPARFDGWKSALRRVAALSAKYSD